MAFGQSFGQSVRRSGFLRCMLCLLLLYSGISVAPSQFQMDPRFTYNIFMIPPDNTVVSRNFNLTTAFRVSRHIVSPILCKGFSSSRVSYYPNSVASYQITLLQLCGDVNPNPGPICTVQHISTEQHKTTPLLTFYANARSIVNKTSKLELDIATWHYDIIVLTETHLDNSISDGEIFPNNYTVFRRDRSFNGRHGGGVLIATRNHIKAVPHDTSQYDSEFIFIDILFSHNR